jgi:hypothetical protein
VKITNTFTEGRSYPSKFGDFKMRVVWEYHGPEDMTMDHVKGEGRGEWGGRIHYDFRVWEHKPETSGVKQP